MQTQCKTCVMDRSANEITFDKNGVCNFCHQAQYELALVAPLKDDRILYGELLFEIKWAGQGKKYDCLIGLSGGVDSSYLLHKAIELGLRPLCFSVDNGWNDPKADENIMRLVETLKVPFYRYTIDLAKFRELQVAFLKAGLPNAEIPTDHILMATSYEMAHKYGIKYILSGGNVATESIMPPSWGYNARDLVHIKAVYKKMTGKTLSGLPVCSLLKWNYYRWIARIKMAYLLDYLYYNRNEAARILAQDYGWKEYGEKHCESVFTAWFQNYYLYEKFGIDKRKAHLSSLINSGQMTRDEALENLTKNPVYPHLPRLEKVMEFKRHSHEEYPHDNYDLIASFIKLWKS